MSPATRSSISSALPTMCASFVRSPPPPGWYGSSSTRSVTCHNPRSLHSLRAFCCCLFHPLPPARFCRLRSVVPRRLPAPAVLPRRHLCRLLRLPLPSRLPMPRLELRLTLRRHPAHLHRSHHPLLSSRRSFTCRRLLLGWRAAPLPAPRRPLASLRRSMRGLRRRHLRTHRLPLCCPRALRPPRRPPPAPFRSPCCRLCAAFVAQYALPYAHSTSLLAACKVSSCVVECGGVRCVSLGHSVR